MPTSAGQSRGGGASAADIRAAVDAYLADNPPSGGPALREFRGFLTDSAGVQQGDARILRRYDGEFIVYLQTSAAAPRVGFLIPAGTTLTDVRNVRTGATIMANFDADPGNARRFIYDRDLRAGRQVLMVRVEDAA